MSDPYDLERFVAAQDGVYEQALAELKRGRKTGHWMWFVFPQIAGLGSSPMAERYAIGSRAEARAYFDHPVLGARLRACAQTVNRLAGHDAHAVFGAPDDLKFRSSMTLFTLAAPEEPAFAEALDKYYGGTRDPLTLAKVGKT